METVNPSEGPPGPRTASFASFILKGFYFTPCDFVINTRFIYFIFFIWNFSTMNEIRNFVLMHDLHDLHELLRRFRMLLLVQGPDTSASGFYLTFYYLLLFIISSSNNSKSINIIEQIKHLHMSLHMYTCNVQSHSLLVYPTLCVNVRRLIV